MNNLLSLNVACGELAGSSCQDDTTVSLLSYQGRFVQKFDSPCDAFFRQSNTEHNNVHLVNPLTDFSVTSITQTSSDSFDESELTVVSDSIRDEYVTGKPDEGFVYELFPFLGNSLCGQSYLSENEPDLSEQTPLNRLNLNHHLTNLPADIANLQDSRPVTVANPLNLQQATSDNPVNSTNIFANKSSQAERLRKLYHNNPAFANRRKEYQRQRYWNDPAFAERKREYQRQRERNDPTIAERRKVRRRELHRNDPALAERYRERQRGRKERWQKRLRERCKNDPVYAKGRRIHNNTYNKMKRKVGKEEASRLASVARAEYLQSVKSSEDSGNLPQLPIQLRQHNASKI